MDAHPGRIGATYEALGLVGDAKPVLGALAGRLQGPPRDDGPARTATLRHRIAEARAEPELDLLRTIRAGLPREAVTAWDMTILAYWAAAHFPVYTGSRTMPSSLPTRSMASNAASVTAP